MKTGGSNSQDMSRKVRCALNEIVGSSGNDTFYNCR